MRKFYLLTLALLVFGLTADAKWKFHYGSGSKDDPYIIDGEEWSILCDNVLEGNSYKGKYFKLKNDIMINNHEGRMLGDFSHPFSGIFDGDGHTIEVKIDAYHQDYLAPFRFIKGATIKNVRATGFINAGQFAGGLVSYAWGKDNRIINCRSSITFSHQRDNYVYYYCCPIKIGID